MVLLYNKDLFDKAGIPYPNNNWKWEDLRNAAKKLTKNNNGDGKTYQWGKALKQLSRHLKMQ
jgi:multiple sugar transport system substrate-binding protein